MTVYSTPPSEGLDCSVLAVYFGFYFCYYCLVLVGVAVGLALLRCLADLAVESVPLHCPVDVFAEAFDYLADVAVLAVVLHRFLVDLAVAVFDYFPVVAALVLAVHVDLDFDFAALADLD